MLSCSLLVLPESKSSSPRLLTTFEGHWRLGITRIQFFHHHLQPQIVREEANKNQLEGIQNDGKNLLDQSLIPDVYFTIELRTITFVQDSKQNLISHFLSIFLIRFKPMIKQFSHFSYGGIGKRKPNWLNGNSSKSNILWVTFLAASTSSIPPSGSHQDPTTSSLVAEPPNSI